ncbi:MAG TPA: hypothetical protein VKC57_03760 [Ktedonobacterales bacterium]|nr:hypothetical protein [Ktedonobacterales bacterium]
MATPLPQPDAQYARDIDAAFARRGRTILQLLGPYDAESDQRKARLDFNAAAAGVDPQFAADVEAAQDALRRRQRRPVAACDACGGAMDVLEPGQRYHPMCEPPEEPAPSGAPDDEEDW